MSQEPDASPDGPAARQPGWGPPPPNWGSSPPPRPAQTPRPEPGGAPLGGPPPGHGAQQVPQSPGPAKPGVVELRPLSLPDLLDGTFAVLRRAPLPTLVNAAVVHVALGALGLALFGWLLAPAMGLEDALLEGSLDPEDAEAFVQLLRAAFPYPWYLYGAAAVLVVLAQLLAYALVAGPASVAAMRATLDRPTSWGRGYSLSRAALPKLVGLELVLALAAMVPVALLAVLGYLLVSALGVVALVPLVLLGVGIALGILWVAVRLVLAPVLLVTQSPTMGGALGRSWRLTRGSWWRTFGMVLVVAMVISVLGGIISTILGVVSTAPGGAVGAGILLLLTGVVNALITALGTLIIQVLLTLLQVDLRIRRERLDLALLGELGDPGAHPIPGHDAADPYRAR